MSDPATATRIPPRAFVTLTCGCSAQDAAWYGRLVLTGANLCDEAAPLMANLTDAAREQAACHNPPLEAEREIFRAAQAKTAGALAALYSHVESNRPAVNP